MQCNGNAAFNIDSYKEVANELYIQGDSIEKWMANWATNGSWIRLHLDARGYCEIRWNPASDINIVPFIETGYLQSSAFYVVIQGNGFPMR